MSIAQQKIRLQNWWVEFNPETKKVFRLSPRKISSKSNEVFVTNNPICGRIMDGTITLRRCSLYYDEVNEIWDITEKANVLVLDDQVSTLYKLQDQGGQLAKEVMVRIFKDPGIISVSINKQNISKSYSMANIDQIKKQGGEHFSLFATVKNNPDYLIKALPVDTSELFEQNKVTINTGIIGNEWDNISLYMRPVLKMYGIEYYNDLVQTDEMDQTNKIIQTTRRQGGYHGGIFNKRGRHIIFDKTYLMGFTDLVRNVQRLDFVVCNKHIDNYVGGFSIHKDKLLNDKLKQIEVRLGFVMPSDPLIVYKNKRVAIKYLGESNK